MNSRGSVRSVLPVRMLLFLFLLLPSWSGALFPTPPRDSDQLLALLDDARRLELHDDPYWHTLLHYKKGLFGLRSLVDDDKFFLSPEGKKNPEAELRATIRAFFDPIRDGGRHPVCRFIARYDWLKERLSFKESQLPVPGCRPFEQLMEHIRPESVTLIFPTSHMNSPASMYGHTLLTIETAYESKLLAYAINYSAFTNETFGPFYIVKGLLGLYPGYFSILPYYAKLQEYSDVNDRDIWEYSLKLNRDEVRRLMMHIYELQEIGSDYYFFSENCSYDLLFLLDAARPGLDLTDRASWWVIPLDTIRLVKKAGLMSDVIFRPSKSTKIKHIASLLPESGQEQALSIAAGDQPAESVLTSGRGRDEKIAVLDLASEYLQYRHSKKELPKDQYLDRFLKTLEARSSLGDADEERYSIPVPGRPDEGHHSNRFSVGYGANDDRPFQEIRLRPAYHVLLDNESGYKRGSQIVFVDAVLRYHSLERDFEIENVDLINIVSIAPRNAFFKHTSWKISTGFFRRQMDNGENYMIYGLNPGFGYAYESRLLGLWYMMFESDFHVGGALEHSYSLGGGGSTGILKNLTSWWKLHLFARDVYHGFGDEDNLLRTGLGQNFRIAADLSISGEVVFREERNHNLIESVIQLNRFF